MAGPVVSAIAPELSGVLNMVQDTAGKVSDVSGSGRVTGGSRLRRMRR